MTGRPPLTVRVMGRLLSGAVAYTPWLWPVIRGFTHRFWNRMASGWDKRLSPERTAALEAGLEHVAETSQRPRHSADSGTFGAPRRILEVGTGTGSGAAAIARRFPDAELTAVDIAEEMVSRARERVPTARFEVADAATLPFADRSFDLVVQLNVPVYFKELARVTAVGGCILIASTFGPATPYYTPHRLLRRRFRRLGLELEAAEQAPPGDFFITCRPS